MKTIGIHFPAWLYRSAETDRVFADELTRTINASGRYRAVQVDISASRISTNSHAERFCGERELALIVHHDSAFFSTSRRYMTAMRLLEGRVPMMNTYASHAIGHNKILTKRRLRSFGIPVLDDAVVASPADLWACLKEGAWYVVKPPDKGAGAGVKLVKMDGRTLFQHRNGKWLPLAADVARSGALRLKLGWGFHSSFTYSPLLVEPYFNDDAGGFSSLRCTVVGDAVVEAVKRTNRREITSNVSGGGTAATVRLTRDQEAMAVAAVKAIGADYAGVDLLVCGGKSVVGEVNIGPFTVFSAYTGAHVGAALAEYAMIACDGAMRGPSV